MTLARGTREVREGCCTKAIYKEDEMIVRSGQKGCFPHYITKQSEKIGIIAHKSYFFTTFVPKCDYSKT